MKTFKVVLIAVIVSLAAINLLTGIVGMFVEVELPDASTQYGINGGVCWLMALYVLDKTKEKSDE